MKSIYTFFLAFAVALATVGEAQAQLLNRGYVSIEAIQGGPRTGPDAGLYIQVKRDPLQGVARYDTGVYTNAQGQAYASIPLVFGAQNNITLTWQDCDGRILNQSQLVTDSGAFFYVVTCTERAQNRCGGFNPAVSLNISGLTATLTSSVYAPPQGNYYWSTFFEANSLPTNQLSHTYGSAGPITIVQRIYKAFDSCSIGIVKNGYVGDSTQASQIATGRVEGARPAGFAYDTLLAEGFSLDSSIYSSILCFGDSTDVLHNYFNLLLPLGRYKFRVSPINANSIYLPTYWPAQDSGFVHHDALDWTEARVFNNYHGNQFGMLWAMAVRDSNVTGPLRLQVSLSGDGRPMHILGGSGQFTFRSEQARFVLKSRSGKTLASGKLPDPATPFTFTGLPAGRYKLLVDVPRAQPAEFDVELVGSSSSVTTRLALSATSSSVAITTSVDASLASGYVSVYPQPAKGAATVYAEGLGATATATLHTVLGQAVRTSTLQFANSRATLSLDGLAKGIYMLHLQGANGVDKVVKMQVE